MSNKPIEVLSEMDAGIFVDKFDQALTDAGRAAVNFGKPSKVTVEFTFKQLSNTRQCDVAHKIKTDTPHATGKTVDEDTKSTPMHIHTDGKISIFSEEQAQFDFQQKT